MKISLITVSFNSAKTIEDTIKSVAAQRHREVEYIIIDGKSRDSTMEIVSRYPEVVTISISESDTGLYNAMNKGLQMATGDIVGFINSDDVLADENVLLDVAKCYEDETTELCYADLVYVTSDNRRVVRYFQSRKFTPGQFLNGVCPPHPTFYIKRSNLLKCGYFREDLRVAADFDFMLRYLELNNLKSKYVPRVWVRMRVGGESGQGITGILQQNKEIISVLKAHKMKPNVSTFTLIKIVDRILQFTRGFLFQLRHTS